MIDSTSTSSPFATTLNFSEFGEHAKIIEGLPYFAPQPHSLWDEVKLMVCVIREATRTNVLLLDGSNGRLYPDVLACMVIGFMPRSRRPAIALWGEMWQPNHSMRGMIERIIVKLSDRAINRYFVLTSDEMTRFPQQWGLDATKTRLLPYFSSFSEKDLAEPVESWGQHIFAGGNAHRDYRPLVEAARQLPHLKFVLATRLLDQVVDAPPNVTARPMSHQEFVHCMRTAAAVVVPLQQNLVRSAGQQTFLNAMYLKKPTIVSNALGVGDYITHYKDGMIVDGTSQGYVQALQWVFDANNATDVANMRSAAHHTVANRFTVRHYAARVVELMRELADEKR